MIVVRPKLHRRRGAILLNVMIFMIVISIVIAGMAMLMVSDNSVGVVESSYSNSLAIAEAGVNYELRKISNSAVSADQKQLIGTPGISYTTTAGTFSVYVTQRNSDGSETTPWVPGQNLWIYSTGGTGNLKRTVKVAAAPSSTAPASNYAVFGVSQGIMNSGPTIVQGDVGTNGFFTFNGHPGITGSVVFNGLTSNWQSPPNGTYTVAHNLLPVTWPTVESLAVTAFGATGLTYLVTHNDNALANPPITGNFVLVSSNQTFVGKAGGANYYVTSLTCNSGSEIRFDNSKGPINIWCGPSGSSSTFNFSGGTANTKYSTDPTKAVRIYVATSNDIQLNGSLELDAGIYNVNNAGSGRVLFNGNPAIYGMVISNMFTFNGTPTIYNTQGYFTPSGGTVYYQCVQPWQEVSNVY